MTFHVGAFEIPRFQRYSRSPILFTLRDRRIKARVKAIHVIICTCTLTCPQNLCFEPEARIFYIFKNLFNFTQGNTKPCECSTNTYLFIGTSLHTKVPPPSWRSKTARSRVMMDAFVTFVKKSYHGNRGSIAICSSSTTLIVSIRWIIFNWFFFGPVCSC